MLDVRELRRQAQEFDGAGKWKESAEIYRQITSRGEANFWDQHNLARAALYGGDVQTAQTLIETLPTRDADMAAVGLLKASLLERQGHESAAAEEWVKARRAGASPYWTLFGESRSLLRLGRLFEAQRAMTAALAEPGAEESGLRFALSVDLRLLDHRAAEEKFQRLRAGVAERELALLDSLPGMTYPQERIAVFSAARQMTGNGQIVDLGCFLGSLTAAMALGLSANGHALSKGVRVHAFDNFRWYAPIMDQFWRENFPGHKLQGGESFRHLFTHITGTWAPFIEVRDGDLLNQRWSEPIEVMSIDAMKSPALAQHIIAEFMPHLIPGAVMFHQDFCFDATWWIHIYHYLLRDHFELSDRLPGASGMMFRVVSPTTSEDTRRVLSHDLQDTNVADAAFAFSLEMAAEEDRPAVAAARARYFTETELS